jgi:hypothetical protein
VVHDAPLVLCDKRSVNGDELLGEDKVHVDFVEEGQYMKYRSTQKWYWLSEQTRDEVTVFVTWDSDEKEQCGEILNQSSILKRGLTFHSMLTSFSFPKSSCTFQSSP